MPRTSLSEPSETPGELHREGGRFRDAAGKFALVGAIMIAVGAVLIFAANGLAEFFGWVLLSLGAVPAVVGLGLLLTALVARRAAKGRSFA